MSNAAFTAIVYLEIMKKMAALVIELSKTSKVKRRFSALGLNPKEWVSTKVLWFSSKLYSLDEINEIHQSKDWNRVRSGEQSIAEKCRRELMFPRKI